MTRNIRKIVSVICAVALLLSLCAVSFIGSSSAIHLDAVESDNTTWSWVDGNVVLDLTFEGANNGGVAMSTTSYGNTYVENGALYIGNGANSAGTAWLAKDNTTNSGTGKVIFSSKTNCTPENTLSAGLFELKPNTSYKITYKYAYRNDSRESRAIEFMAAVDPYLSSNHERGSGISAAVATWYQSAPAPVVETTIAGDQGYGEWKEDVLIFTTKETLKNKYLGVRTAHNASAGLYAKFDSIVIEEGTVASNVDSTVVYNWTTEGATPQYYNPNDNNYVSDSDKTDNDASKGSFVDANGMHFSFAHSSSPAYNRSWVKKAIVKTGHTDGGTLIFDANNNYIITMKYKPELIAAGQRAYIGIGYGAPKSTIGTLKHAYHEAALDDWQYLTTIVSGADIAGNTLHLTGGSQGGRCSFLVESVTVRTVNHSIVTFETAYGDIDTEMTFVKEGATLSSMPIPTNVPEGKGFAGWYAGDVLVDNAWTAPKGVTNLTARFSNTISAVTFDNQGAQTTSNIAVGLDLPDPVRPHANLFFEGWYLEPTFKTQVTTVPDYDVTLYAKYNGTFLGFNNISHVAGEATGSPAIVVDPDDADNNVVKFEASKNARPNFMLPAYDIVGSEGFELKPNTTYVVSYKAKKTDAEGADAGITFFQGDHKSGDGTTRTSISGSNGGAASTEWVTNSFSFTTGETLYLERVKWSYQNHIFFTIYNSSSNISVYVDDICIAEALTEAPEGAVGIYFETNANDMVPMYGFTGESIPELASPTLGGHNFIGWYADKNLTTPFTALTFGDKDITLYAKWEAVPFLVDFSDYEDGGKNKPARAKFETDANGNDYLDWWVNHATTNTSDTKSAYRVFMNKAGNHYTVDTGSQYTFTFKYKLLEGNVTIHAVTNGMLNGWNSYKQHTESLVLNKVTEEWKEGSLTFTAEPEAGGKYLSFGIAGHGHVIVDDIYIEASGGRANLYGSTAIFFNSNGGNNVSAISGDPGEAIGKLPVPVKAGYAFDKWYTDAELTTPFTDKVWGEEDMTLYASWSIAKFNESFEDYPNSVLAQGISGGYKLYKDTTTGFDKANVQKGAVSIYRDGTQTGTKAFTLCRSNDLELTVGKQYTVTFYVKPEAINDAAGTISLIGMSANTGIAAPKSTNVITTIGDLKAGEWQKVSYTFTADQKYVGISTTAGNNMYLDNFTLTLKGYTGTTTGDSSVNPMIIALMVVLAAGALIVTGKKVFEK